MARWYAIHTKPRQEEAACRNLKEQNYSTYLPRIKQMRRQRGKWKPRVEPLFPRYFFIELTLGQENIAPIRYTRGVSRLVNFGGPPCPVPDQLIDLLRSSEEPESGLHAPDQDLFRKGQTVTIVDGPLAGLNAVFQTHDGEQRSIILLDIMGRTQKVRIDRDHLWPAQSG